MVVRTPVFERNGGGTNSDKRRSGRQPKTGKV
jgi:hypothetical protein